MTDIRTTGSIREPKTIPNHALLFEIASEQGGYFTAEQARTSGFSRALLSHHAKTGTYIRIRRGLYRFREYPSSAREEVIAAWLALGKDTAVVSHESALDILGLGNIIPDAAHITVPRSRRHMSSWPGVKVHTTTRRMVKKDLWTRDGIILTSPTRSILDVAEAGIAPEQIEIAVVQAINRGLVNARQLQIESDNRGRRVANLISGAIKQVKR